MFCPGCGANNESGVRFCYRCGRALTDGQEQPAQTGPAWRDFREPQPEPQPEVPSPLTLPEPPLAPQVVVGLPPKPRRFPTAVAIALAGVVAAAVVGGYLVVRPGQSKQPGGPTTVPVRPSSGAAALGSLEVTNCKDSRGADCKLHWDITAIEMKSDGLAISYQVKAIGQAGCSVPLLADKQVIEDQQNQGKPGTFVEGGEGRYYPLLRSEGFNAGGGSASCDRSAGGAWVFALPRGETLVKLRVFALPAAKIDLTRTPHAFEPIPSNDTVTVRKTQSTECKTTVPNQPCTGRWELGPWGITPDGSPILFFAVVFEGQNCQIPWEPDLESHKAARDRGEKGIYLEVPGSADLGLIAQGGFAGFRGNQPCGEIKNGWWKFSPGNVAKLLVLHYPEFPPAQVPISPGP